MFAGTKVDSADYRLFALLREVPDMSDLGLTADIRRMRADNSLARHLYHLSKQRALRLGMQMRLWLLKRCHGVEGV